MVQKTKKVCIGTLKAHAKSDQVWNFDFWTPASKKHTSIFFLGHPFGSKHLGQAMSIWNMNCPSIWGLQDQSGGLLGIKT